MQISWRAILTPWAGALAGYFASKGLTLTPEQVLLLVAACASGAANLLHLLEAWLSPKTAPTVATAVKEADPAKKPPPAAALLLPLILVLPIVNGCSTLGLAPASSADESIAYGYGLYTALEQALSASVAAGQVSTAEARQVDTRAGQARELLDAARAAETVNPSGAATDLQTATGILTALQTWLNHPAGDPPQ